MNPGKPTSSISAKTERKSVQFFHKVAVLSVMAGAGASVGFTIYSGRNNDSVWLILLFAGWVMAPFIALLLVNTVGNRWSVPSRVSLYTLMVAVTVGSLVMYSGIWRVPGTKPAFAFVVVPLLSWFVMGMAVLINASLPNRN